MIVAVNHIHTGLRHLHQGQDCALEENPSRELIRVVASSLGIDVDSVSIEVIAAANEENTSFGTIRPRAVGGDFYVTPVDLDSQFMRDAESLETIEIVIDAGKRRHEDIDLRPPLHELTGQGRHDVGQAAHLDVGKAFDGDHGDMWWFVTHRNLQSTIRKS